MAINIYTVQSDVEAAGWKLISTTYKNLKTPLELICPKGHTVFETYGNWRDNHICEECVKISSGNVTRNKLPTRGKNVITRVLALDAATCTTGYAIYDDKKLVDYGTFNTEGCDNAVMKINQVQNWLQEVIEKTQPDAIGVEDIQLQKNVRMFQTLANLQGVILNTIYTNNLTYKLANSTTWRSFLGIYTAAVRDDAKRQAQAYVKSMFNINATQDEADAICIGYYFAQKFIPKSETIKKQLTWGDEIF